MVKIDLNSFEGRKVPRIIRGSIAAVKKGQTQTIVEILPTVAFKTGEMREIVKEEFSTKELQLLVNKKERKITIKLHRLKKRDFPAKHYSKYHFHPHAAFGKTYKNPTTPGTVPQDTRIWNRRYVKNVNNALPKSFKEQGVKVI